MANPVVKYYDDEVARMEREASESKTKWPPDSPESQAREEVREWARQWPGPILSNKGVFSVALNDLYRRVERLEGEG